MFNSNYPEEEREVWEKEEGMVWETRESTSKGIGEGEEPWVE
jgi:hypothetical protein